MNLSCPVLTNNLFLQYGKDNKKVKTQNIKKYKIKNPAKIRDNVRNIMNEKYRKAIELSAQIASQDQEEKKVADNSENIMPLTQQNLTSALLRWGLLCKWTPKPTTKKKRSKARKQARKNKQFAQNYSFEPKYQELKKLNLIKMVHDLNEEDFSKMVQKAYETLDLHIFAVALSVVDMLIKDAEEYEQQKLADIYFNKSENTDMAFAEQIHDEKIKQTMQKHENFDEEIDLQDLYELSHNNMRVVINTVNQRNR